ncbi:MAG: cyoC [Parcubacteria group bacterium]|nr:cyoC [Parcubacteria group bacterium]
MNGIMNDMKKDSTTVFGFWVYLMTDFVLFASLFAVYAVLHANTFGGVGGKDIFNAPFVLIETIILLTSSFTTGLALLAAKAGKKWWVLILLLATAALGAAFVSLEFSEFSTLVLEGHRWTQSGFLSAYFTLVGTHGLHVLIGLLWMVALMIAIIRHGLTQPNMRKLLLFSLFWHFLDIIWIFIFTLVYLFGLL